MSVVSLTSLNNTATKCLGRRKGKGGEGEKIRWRRSFVTPGRVGECLHPVFLYADCSSHFLVPGQSERTERITTKEEVTAANSLRTTVCGGNAFVILNSRT